ncbi:MAG: 2,3-bisphosphoglycerate-independent phosphoglycerate mutase [Chloroflexi bacterium]|nr:2,3-bisphosphoglycerate-independent phosphoglycerate mutase [Chloroflexota bacterium]
MADFELIKSLARKTDTKIVLLVMDGLGGIPHPKTLRTELEAARKDNLDRLARSSQTGLSIPVAHGITPGSGPGHLALFGYDPIKYLIGRGILEALGLDMDVRDGDVAARGNFCTLDDDGLIIDRRAGRIPTETNTELTTLLNGISVDNATPIVASGREHRFAMLFRPEDGGPQLSDALTDSDPQREGLAPLTVTATEPWADSTAGIINTFLEKAASAVADRHPANGLVLRGFSTTPDLPQMSDVYGLNPAAIAAYPMYRGLAELVGMNVVETGDTIEDQIRTTRDIWNNHDFFFVHYKYTDSAGEDGDYDAKVAAIERLDNALPALLDLDPDVLVVAGDHSTPSAMAAHSWHPVPVMIRSRHVTAGFAEAFTERECAKGMLGTMAATDIMPLALANAGKLDKFGA